MKRKRDTIFFTNVFTDTISYDSITVALTKEKNARAKSIYRSNFSFWPSNTIQRCGRGGNGTVFCISYRNQVDAAIKIIPYNHDEVANLRRMKSKICHFVPFFILSENQDGAAVIAMTKMDGIFRSLFPQLEYKNILMIGRQKVRDLLCMIQKTGLYYTDINPENIMYKQLDATNVYVQFIDYGSLVTKDEAPFTIFPFPPHRKATTTKEVDVMWPLIVTLCEFFVRQQKTKKQADAIMYSLRADQLFRRRTNERIGAFIHIVPPLFQSILNDMLAGTLSTLKALVLRLNDPEREVYDIDKIVGRVKDRQGRVHYKVKWHGYPITVEPRKELVKDVPELLEAFDQQSRGRK